MSVKINVIICTLPICGHFMTVILFVILYSNLFYCKNTALHYVLGQGPILKYKPLKLHLMIQCVGFSRNYCKKLNL